MKPIPCPTCRGDILARQRCRACCGTGFLLVPEKDEERLQKPQATSRFSLDERQSGKQEGAGSAERLAQKEAPCAE